MVYMPRYNLPNTMSQGEKSCRNDTQNVTNRYVHLPQSDPVNLKFDSAVLKKDI